MKKAPFTIVPPILASFFKLNIQFHIKRIEMLYTYFTLVFTVRNYYNTFLFHVLPKALIFNPKKFTSLCNTMKDCDL